MSNMDCHGGALSCWWCAWLQDKEVHVFKLYVSGAPPSVLEQLQMHHAWIH